MPPAGLSPPFHASILVGMSGEKRESKPQMQRFTILNLSGRPSPLRPPNFLRRVCAGLQVVVLFEEGFGVYEGFLFFFF